MTITIDANPMQLKLLDGILNALKENHAIEAYDLEFEKKRDFFHNRLKDVESGKSALISHETMKERIVNLSTLTLPLFVILSTKVM